MLAAEAGVPYRIPFGGRGQLQHARDVARAFIAASEAETAGASVHNLPGPSVSIDEVVAAIAEVVPASAGSISHGDETLPLPEEVDSHSFYELAPGFTDTPLLEGVRLTVERFRTLLSDGLVAAPVPDPKEAR
jgi:nucleoside-diphosphate-sugar epimerase